MFHNVSVSGYEWLITHIFLVLPVSQFECVNSDNVNELTSDYFAKTLAES